MAGVNFGSKVVQRAAAAHTATVIFLHGLGDTGSGLSNIGPALRLPHVKFVFPTAPSRSVTINGGAVMPAWFDLYNMASLLAGKVDQEGIQQSLTYLGSLIKEEVDAGIPPDRIVVGGFSQGGHIALRYLLSGLQPVSGCIALSTWVEPSAKDSVQVSDAAKKTKVFIGHGTADTLVPVPLSTATAQLLRGSGFEGIHLKTYPGVAHSTSMQEIDDVRDFLVSTLPDKPVPAPTPEDVDRMSVKDLKALLRQRQVDPTGILEKSELIARVKALI